MENIQDEVMKIHHKYGTTEMANYQIQLLFDKNYLQLQTRIKELEEKCKSEYKRGIEDDKIIAEHGTTMYEE